MHIKYLLLSCLLGLNSAIVLAQDTHLFSYDIGTHINYFQDDGYFQFKSNQSVQDQSLRIGFDAGVNYHFGHHFTSNSLFNPFSVSLGWSDFGDYTASHNSACNGQSCIKQTSLKHNALMLSLHYEALSNSVADIDVYAGVSNVLAEGKINDVEWENNATGAQIGANFVFMPSSSVQPFFGLRLHSFYIEQGSEVAKVKRYQSFIGYPFLVAPTLSI